MLIRWFTMAGLVVTAVAGGCGKSDDNPSTAGGACTTGTEKCDCYPNGSCNTGLTCLSQVCVAGPDGGGTSSSSATSGGGAGGNGSSGAGMGGNPNSTSAGGAAGTAGPGVGGATGGGGSPIDGGGGISGAGGAGGNGGAIAEAGSEAGAGPGGGAGAAGGSAGSGGAAGAGGTSGSAGDGGTVIDAGSRGCKDPTIIDDFEDDDAVVCLSGGRVGVWVNDNDHSIGSVQLPSPFLPSALIPARGENTRAAHTTGSGFSIWGGGISAGLNKSLEANSVAAPYDASAYRAITFWLKAAPGTQLAVGFQTASTIPASEGGHCIETCPNPVLGGCSPDCYNPFRRVITIPNTDDGSWKQLVINLNSIDLTQWKITGQSFDRKELISIFFSAVAPPTSFEFWIDDVAFVQ